MLIGHLYIFFGALSLSFPCPFLYGLFVFWMLNFSSYALRMGVLEEEPETSCLLMPRRKLLQHKVGDKMPVACFSQGSTITLDWDLSWEGALCSWGQPPGMEHHLLAGGRQGSGLWLECLTLLLFLLNCSSLS